MTKETFSCSACGSALPDGVTLCDVCGHDRLVDVRAAAVRAERARGTAAESGGNTGGSEAAPRQRAGGAKASARKTGGSGASARAAGPLFNTPQWMAIVVAAFILGGVAGASFVPSGGNASTGAGETAGQAQQGAQPDIARLDATRAALEANPDDPDALLAYSHALHDSGMPAQAIVQYRRYLEFRPDDPDARVDLGICYFETKDYTNAITEMERAVAGHPTHQLGHYNLGIVNLNAGNKDKAREWFEKARDINPTSPHGQNAIQLLKEHF